MIVGILFVSDNDLILEVRLGERILLVFELILGVVGLFIVIKNSII